MLDSVEAPRIDEAQKGQGSWVGSFAEGRIMLFNNHQDVHATNLSLNPFNPKLG